MNARIGHEDFKHLKTFPDARKAIVMGKIMARSPEETVVQDGKNAFEKHVIKLRRSGFGLIDLQPQEAACVTVWYRRKPSLLKALSEEVAMLMWEVQDCGEATTLLTWRV